MEPHAATSDTITTIRGRRLRLASFAAGTLLGVYMFGTFADPQLLGGGAPTFGWRMELGILIGVAAGLLGYLFLTGVNAVELRPEGIRVRTPLRSTLVPWDDLIRFHCDPAFAEMALVFAARDHRGRRRPAWLAVTERQGRAILSDPRSAWVPVEGRFPRRGLAPS